jgi:Concanavalin A-like lectin/glucanases superfamily/HYDIN/CFA65/VesB-like, Ig-like domain
MRLTSIAPVLPLRPHRLAFLVLAAFVVGAGCGADPLTANPAPLNDASTDPDASNGGHPPPVDSGGAGNDDPGGGGQDTTHPQPEAGPDATAGADSGAGAGADSGAGADADADADADAKSSQPAPPAPVSVLTQHNDTARTGANLSETVLTTANVNVAQFGKLFCWSVDDQVYAQPLVATGVHVAAGVRDVVYVATMNDTVYAFDANDAAAAAPLWSKSFLAPGVVPVMNTDMTGACGGAYTDISANIGILGTPVIDPANSTMYLVARTKEGGGTQFVQKLHALDITNGSERPGSPTTIVASVPGTGEGGTTINFDPLKQNQRAALLLAGGVVYIAWASHCDWGPFHGWLLAYDAQTLQQIAAYNSTPDGDAGGIWMSGQGPAMDSSGSIYLVTGNGTVGTAADPAADRNRGQSFLRLTRSGSSFTVATFFTPHDYQALNGADLDLGSGGPLLVPGTNLVVSGGKGSKLYAVDRTTMSGLHVGRTEDSSVQSVALNAMHLHGAPVYWNGPGGPLIYTWAEYDHLKSFHLDAASRLDPIPLASSPNPAPDGMPGGMLSISANGATEGTGILWAYLPEMGDANQAVVPGELHAFDAANVGVELWNTAQNPGRDSTGNFGKYASPTVANGRVYVATFSQAVCVYGLLPGVQPLEAPTNLTASATSKTSAALQWVAHSTAETSFSIERKEGALGFAPIAMAPKGATSYVDSTGSPFARYSYRVRARRTGAPSAYSNTASVTLDAGAPAARLRITGAGHFIANGAAQPSWTTDTDFAIVGVGANASHTFTIENVGNAALTLSGPVTIGGANAGDFSINTAPPAAVAAGVTATFQVSFAPGALGAKIATVQIPSNDPDQSPYTFAVGGRALGDQLGYWALDETAGQTAADSSDVRNNGTTTAVTWVAGHTAGGASFDGMTSAIVVPEDASLDPYAITIAAWINPVDWNGNRRVLQKGANDDQYRLLAEGGVFKFDVSGVGAIMTALPTVNVWTHVAGTYDGATLRLYVNGVEAVSAAATTPMPATSDPLFIGAKGAAGAAGDHFSGVLDEVRLYGRALSQTEIMTIAQ